MSARPNGAVSPAKSLGYSVVATIATPAQVQSKPQEDSLNRGPQDSTDATDSMTDVDVLSVDLDC